MSMSTDILKYVNRKAGALGDTLEDIHREKQSCATRRPLRVLHYDGFTGGMYGVESFILQLCVAQLRAGLSPSVALDMEDREIFMEMARSRDIPVHSLPQREGIELRLPRRFALWLLRVRRVKLLARLLREADVLHIHEGILAFDAFVAARLAGVRSIVVTHHASMTYHKASWRRLATLTFWMEKRWASRIAIPYDAAAAEYIDAGLPQSRASVVPFCADEQLFVGGAEDPAPGALTLAILGRLFTGKGHKELLAAMARLAPRHPGLRLLIIGDGPTRSELEAGVEQLGLRGVVEFLGNIEHREVPAILKRAHVIALPSYMHGETFPLCLLEGMALGLPAIGARWFGIPDIIVDGQTGILVDPGDVEGLSRAIERFISDRPFYFEARCNAVARFRARFTSTAVADAYLSLYRAGE